MNKKELIILKKKLQIYLIKEKFVLLFICIKVNENKIIEFFKRVKKNDWIFCSWRSHYQCLLKGVPKEEVKKEILSGRSISLCFPKYKIYSSALVGGSVPIAVGTALSLKLRNEKNNGLLFYG